jgi:hypothetical protein
MDNKWMGIWVWWDGMALYFSSFLPCLSMDGWMDGYMTRNDLPLALFIHVSACLARDGLDIDSAWLPACRVAELLSWMRSRAEI